MKKVLLLCLMILGFGFNVYADSDGPSIAIYDVYVSNKDGAVCYEYENNNYKKINKTISYGTKVSFYSETSDKYINVDYYDDKDEWQGNCYVETKNLSPKNSEYNLKSEDIVKINPVKAVILANGGLNLRKGPATIFSKITLIPQYSVVTLKYKVGTYWYYAEYNGKSGWITGENSYFGINDDAILYSVNDIEIFSDKALTKKVGTIPKFTEFTNYLTLVDYEPAYYVNYNGTKGYIKYTTHKVNGKVKINSDTTLTKRDGTKQNIKKGEVLNYSIESCDSVETKKVWNYVCTFYIPKFDGIIKLIDNDNTNFTNQGSIDDIKTKGFIGEGLFGEKKESNVDTTEEVKYEEIEDAKVDPKEIIDVNDIKEETKKESKMNNETIIIIVLACIVIALTTIIIIKLVNIKKKEKEVVKKEK